MWLNSAEAHLFCVEVRIVSTENDFQAIEYIYLLLERDIVTEFHLQPRAWQSTRPDKY